MTKPREKTREKLTAEIEDGKKKIRQFENREKVLRRKLSIVNNSTHFDISKSTLPVAGNVPRYYRAAAPLGAWGKCCWLHQYGARQNDL